MPPGQSRSVSTLAQWVVFALALAVIAFIIWKFVPRLLRQRRQGKKRGKRGVRVVLGETLAADQTASDLLAEAEGLARAGHLRAAIRKGYIALLCELGDRKCQLAQHKLSRSTCRARQAHCTPSETTDATSRNTGILQLRPTKTGQPSATVPRRHLSSQSKSKVKNDLDFDLGLWTLTLDFHSAQSLPSLSPSCSDSGCGLCYATSYVSPEQRVDSEYNPDRSTYNPGATGTRAFYDLLIETGRKVIRWREAPAALLNTGGEARPETFVVVGETLVPFEEDEVRTLLRWVEGGGRLVIIDRMPDARLLPAPGNWHISTELLHTDY